MPKKVSQKTWIQQELQTLKNSTLVLVVVVFAVLGVLVGYYLSSDSFRGPFRNVSYAYEGTAMHVSWQTSFPARTKVEYGTSQVYLNETNLTNGFETAHEMDVQGLLPSKAHYFRLVAEDNTGQKYISPFYSTH